MATLMSKPTGLPAGETQTAEGFFTRERLSVLVLLAASALVAVVCYKLARPFLPAFTWALALGVAAHPAYRWLDRRIRNRNLSAALATACVGLLIIAPATYVAAQLFQQALEFADILERQGGLEGLLARVRQSPYLGQAVGWLETQADVQEEKERLRDSVQERVGPFLQGTAWTAVQLFIAHFALFYFFRDGRSVIRFLRSISPLSEGETDQIFGRVVAIIHATLYGVLVVAAIQGTLGGLMFWILGLPAPLLWGVVMAILAAVPLMGPFMIWLPAAAVLGFQGDWIRAFILAGWGMLVVSLIDNFLYPILVGREIRLHTLPVFVGILGGVLLFGPAGVVLGPLILALADALIRIWRRRTSWGQAADRFT
jgi:predicted PurR-regulated permease PerM